MPVIYCALNMFAVNQKIYIMKDNHIVSVAESSAPEMAKVIANLCKENNITKVNLSGNKRYLNVIASEIQTNYNLNYHNNKPLSIEVNEL